VSNRLIENHLRSSGEPEDVLTDVDYAFMNRARELARRGAGRTGPNPTVGAVVVRDGREVATGYHRQNGDAHAEAVALNQAGEAARGATLYVTLEPCAHQGRTPPCVEQIVQAGIARVVFPAIDPDPRVRGRGMAALRDAGVRVDMGCLHDAAILDSLVFYHDRLEITPTVSLKMAITSDGKVARARGSRDDVTEKEARTDAHALRAAHDAVVIGVETMLIDRPLLDCRLLEGGVDREPMPVVLDTHARTPPDNQWSRSDREYVVICAPSADSTRVRALGRAGARVLHARAGARGLDIADTLRALREHCLHRILVEGGPSVFWSFVDAGAWDALWLYRSPREFGSTGVPLARAGQNLPGRLIDTRALGDDTCEAFVNEPSWEKLTGALSRAVTER
jgi:diaminohydroxyphosphoribosylaminopyrimidine deaminase/5-amino-6-(5-phosphoribosylamino)uracil reductase